MEVLSLCLFFAATVTSEGYLVTKESEHLDDKIRSIVDDILAHQALVYDARITKLEVRIASVYDAKITNLEALQQRQNRKIRMLETREKRQSKIIQNLTSMVNYLTNSEHFRHNERSLTLQIHKTNKGKFNNSKPEGGRKTRGSNMLNFRAIAASEHVAFTAYLDHNINHLAIGHTVQFNQVHLNDGNGYSTFTGEFTAPVSGVYLFTYHWTSQSRITVLELMVDGVQQVAAVAHPVSNNDTMGGQTVIVSVTAGQVVWIEEQYSTDGEINSNSLLKFATFAGTLLY